jgi:oxygen-dependent protoporphyrinogen oxidase
MNGLERPVVIVGGGITGLAAALRCADAGVSFLLVEAEERWGGKISTARREGFVVEGGPDCMLAAKPAGLAFCRSLGLEHRLRGTNPAFRRTFVQRRGRLHELPEGLTGLVPSRIAPLLKTRILSPRGRLRAGLEVAIPARKGTTEESIARFVTRRFGREAYDWLVEPLLSGIYAGDGEQLSLAATFPQLAELERSHGSVVRSMLRRRFQRNAGPAPMGFVTPAGGLAELVDAVVQRLPVESMRRGVTVEAVTVHDDGYQIRLAGGECLTSQAVILATPAFASAKLLGVLDPALARELEAVPFVSTATVSLAFRSSAIPTQGRLDGYGYVSPRAEGSPVVACTWTSNKFPERVPADGVLIRFFIGREGQEEVVTRPDDALVGLARTELTRLFGISAEPLFTQVFRWPRGMPQYVIGHTDRVHRITRRAQRHPGLHLAGASYDGVGIPDCIASGQRAAHATIDRVGVGV